MSSDRTKFYLSCTILTVGAAALSKKPGYVFAGAGLAAGLGGLYCYLSKNYFTDQWWEQNPFGKTLSKLNRGISVNSCRLGFNHFHRDYLSCVPFAMKYLSAAFMPFFMEHTVNYCVLGKSYPSYEYMAKDLTLEVLWEGASHFLLPKVCSAGLSLKRLLLEVSARFIFNVAKNIYLKEYDPYDWKTYGKSAADACIYRGAKLVGCRVGDALRGAGCHEFLASNAHYFSFTVAKNITEDFGVKAYKYCEKNMSDQELILV